MTDLSFSGVPQVPNLGGAQLTFGPGVGSVSGGTNPITSAINGIWSLGTPVASPSGASTQQIVPTAKATGNAGAISNIGAVMGQIFGAMGAKVTPVMGYSPTATPKASAGGGSGSALMVGAALIGAYLLVKR